MAGTQRHNQEWKFAGKGRKRRNNRRFRQETRQAFKRGDYAEIPKYDNYRESGEVNTNE